MDYAKQLGIVCALTMSALATPLAHSQNRDANPISRIAFGSCNRQDKSQDFWSAIVDAQPDAMLLLGDNVYADTQDMEKMRADYGMLAAVKAFGALRKRASLFATWDDHDYGANDAGAEYPMKHESQQILLDFLGVEHDDARRHREGVYHAEIAGPPGKRVQIIMLDTRYHRSSLLRRARPDHTTPEGFPGSYEPNTDPAATVLGETQWRWLEDQLRKPAEVRIIASSIQVVAADHGYEKWANFPHERQRLFDLLRRTRASGVVFVSGDRHRAELSALDDACDKHHTIAPPIYPLYDLTSSALNTSTNRYVNEVNQHRWGSLYTADNFGMIIIDWSRLDPEISLALLDPQGRTVLRKRLNLSELQPR